MIHLGLVPFLEGFKLALDQWRLTIWAVIMADEEDSKRADGLHLGLATKLAEFRIKRLMQMLAELQREIDRGGTPPTPPELCKLSSALEETRKTVSEFCARAA